MVQTAFSNDSNVHRFVPEEVELKTIPATSYCCEYCGYEVKTKSNLRAHMIKTHKIVKDEKDAAFFTKKKASTMHVYHCPIASCKYNINQDIGFSKFSRLKQHYQIVHMQKSYQCTVCNQFFATPTAQTYHSKSCGSIFECPVCSRKYRQKKFLNQHARRSGHKLNNLTPSQSEETTPYSKPVNLSKIVEQPRQVYLQQTILPILILPLDVSSNQISPTIIDTACSKALAHLKRNFNGSVLKADYSQSTNTKVGTQTTNECVENSNNDSEQFDSTLSPSSFQQFSPLPPGYSLLPLVDVGTATKCLADVFTQTDGFAQPQRINESTNASMLPISIQTSTDKELFMPTGNVSPATFFPSMSHASTFISPITSTTPQYRNVKLEKNLMHSNYLYNENNTNFLSNSNLIDSSSFSMPIIDQTNRSLPSEVQFRASQPVAYQNHNGCDSDSMLTDHINRLQTPVLSRGCLLPSTYVVSPAPDTVFAVDHQSSSNHYPSCACTLPTVQSTASNNDNNHRFMNISQENRYVSATEEDINDWMPQNCSSFPLSSSDRLNNWEDDLSSDKASNHHHKSLQFNAPQSVAVETSIDLLGFDKFNSGNCYWPSTGNYTNMHTQTIEDRQMDLWLNDVHTQTAYRQQIWMPQMLDQSVCVGVNTEILTPNNGNMFIG